MTGGAYADLVAAYLARRFAGRGLKVYREISVGKTIIGKNRRVDVFCVCETNNKAFAIECKYQESEGTVDEKVPYALDDLQALPMAGCIAYAGKGFSAGVQHMLEASPHAAHCLPSHGQTECTSETRELDHLLATHFEWWDVLVANKMPINPEAPGPRAAFAKEAGIRNQDSGLGQAPPSLPMSDFLIPDS